MKIMARFNARQGIIYSVLITAIVF
uniref:Uncharacterized protein n=1 Tax=Anguilla anguilla TaxID=7936 RepID=A0A0E9PDX8_ANGAN